MTPLIVDPFLHFLTVMSELHQKKLMSKHDLDRLPHLHIERFNSMHWLDFLVPCQFSKSTVVCAKTFDALKRYSVTEFGKDKEKLGGWLSISAIYLNGSMYVLCNQQYVAYMWQSKLECKQ